MTDRTADQQRVFLSILPASPGERRAALVVALASFAIFLAAVPFAKIQLAKVAAFIPIYQSALIITDLITAVLLLGQFSILKSRALLVLASGYLFTALMIVGHTMSFPGLFAESGLLGAGPQTTAWIYMFWHAGFPLLVIGYAILPPPGNVGDLTWPPGPAIIIAALAVTAIAAALVALTTAGQEMLPPIMDGNRYTPAMNGVVGSVWILSFIALGLLWRRRPHTVLDLWLMVVTFTWLGDVGLSAVFNHGRFDLGFYVGRVFGFAATSFVLLVLLLETRALYARLARSLQAERSILQRTNQALREREDQLRQLNETLEQRVAERSRQLEAEIAERAKTQETLREAQKLEAVGRMAGGIAHDFNNLLTVIQCNAGLLRLKPLGEQNLHSVKAIDRAADRGARLVRQILSFARHQPLRLDVVDLRHRAEELTDMLSRAVRGDIRVLVTMAEDLWSVQCDVTELEIALMNLCVNARDAMPKGGLVRMEGNNRRLSPDHSPIGLSGDFVALNVIDTGTGIAPEDLPRVFEPFFTTKEVGKGTGLGLSQVYGFAKQTGGTAIIDSKLGEGTTVTLYLPRSTLEAEVPEADARSGPDRASGRVLLVEDDSDVADVAKAMLGTIGYKVEHVSDAGTALALLLGGQMFDIVFSDIIMPGGMSGLELARKIRQHFPRMPILLSTGYARAAGEGLKEGFELIAKPYDADSLAKALRRTVADAPAAHLLQVEGSADVLRQ